MQDPFVHHQRRRDAERGHVRQRVILLAERALRIGDARHAPVHAVEHHGREDRDGGHVEAHVHRLHDGEEAGEQRRGGERIGQQVDAAAARPLALVDNVVVVVRGIVVIVFGTAQLVMAERAQVRHVAAADPLVTPIEGNHRSLLSSCGPGQAFVHFTSSSARMVDDADTFSPMVTRGRASSGRYTSTREPKRMKP
ncbi:hypothetical protein D9M69_472110 [compost metagenome]